MDSRLDFIFRRRSIRNFLERPVEEDKQLAILQAAMAAPSSSNRQPWQFVLITDRQLLDQLAEAHPHGKMLFQASLCIAVCGDESVSPAWIQDCSAAMQNLLLAAANLQLGAVWLGVHPRPERIEPVRQLLALPASINPLALAAIGYPAEDKPANTWYLADKIHHQRYGGGSPVFPGKN